ncbi:hypothetical protein ACJMK2_006092 [Sinanodonta woodiana]|uniref:Transposable element P transposase-like RNase H domain-containing protein n=1 Tax=Sinanodonta woodiana TaxID=1069815 RepID=A0ABD3VSI1_SINWO
MPVKSCPIRLPLLLNDNEETIELSNEDSQDLEKCLEQCFPNAPEDMKLLLQSHSAALKANMISICLALWVRSPRTYQDIADSTMMILPTGRYLRRYKNRAPQEAGPQDEIFLWMYQAANDANVPEEGSAGGLIHDETKIQQDLVLDMRGGKLHLVGWVDTGIEGNDLRTVEQGKVEQKLATEVIQIYFLGYTGFRFPICHYPTCSVKASELHIMIWDVIARLQDWVFSDFLHIKKKIRNSIMKNADIRGLHTRKLKLNEKYILWKHLTNAVHCDQEVHSRPTEVSDAHCLPIVSYLNITIELLENTSKMISIFRDHRPVKNVHDECQQYLYDILQWFTKWRISANNDESIAKGERSKSLLLIQCCDDVESMLVTFSEICKRHLEEFPYGGVVQSRFNIDVWKITSTVNSVILGQSLKSRL